MKLILGDSRDDLPKIAPDSIDSIVTDPPYGLGFMGKKWDAADNVAFDPKFWAECLRVLKPGGHLLAFGGTRTYHRLACAVEDAGFEIRDMVSWLYGSGFPKSLDVSKVIDKKDGRVGFDSPNGGKYGGAGEGMCRPGTVRMPNVEVEIESDKAKKWQGFGTALKPACEPIVLARKPLIGTVAKNVLEYGTGALNIDASRIGYASESDAVAVAVENFSKSQQGTAFMASPPNGRTSSIVGRWPANILLDEEAASLLDEQSGSSVSSRSLMKAGPESGVRGHDDAGGASRFFYVAKPATNEKQKGLAGKGRNVNDGRATSIDNPFQRGDTVRQNTHPTVKPIELMRYLCKLITPPSGTVLDPFMGSGTTGVAAAAEGFDFVGIEREPEYFEIAKQRLGLFAS